MSDGSFAINGNYHGNLGFDWLLSPVSMVHVHEVAIDGKVTINGKVSATGPRFALATFALAIFALVTFVLTTCAPAKWVIPNSVNDFMVVTSQMIFSLIPLLSSAHIMQKMKSLVHGNSDVLINEYDEELTAVIDIHVVVSPYMFLYIKIPFNRVKVSDSCILKFPPFRNGSSFRFFRHMCRGPNKVSIVP